MLTATWRRLGSPFWLAIGLVVLVPALADAQLFPNGTIRRQKPTCAAEPPYYAQVRRDYFGYYPTCWRKFPEGWACPCPNPELPNAAASFIKDPLDLNRKPISGDEGMGPIGPGMDEPNPPDRGNLPRDNPNIPLPDRSRSPFELEDKPRTNPGGVQPPTGDRFDTPPPPTPRPGPGNNRPAPPAGNRPGTSSSLMEMPALPETAPTTSFESRPQPGSMVLPPEATLASNDTSPLRPDLGPLPSAPMPSANTPTNYGNSTETEPTVGVPAPAQAPKRKSLIGSLFNRVSNRTR